MSGEVIELPRAAYLCFDICDLMSPLDKVVFRYMSVNRHDKEGYSDTCSSIATTKVFDRLVPKTKLAYTQTVITSAMTSQQPRWGSLLVLLAKKCQEPFENGTSRTQATKECAVCNMKAVE